MQRPTTKNRHMAASLRTISLFESCSDAELRRIDGLLTRLEIEAGQTLLSEGAIGRQFVIIAAGWARVTRAGVELGLLGPGSFFGEMALLGTPQRTATVSAICPMVVETVNPGEFRELLRAAPSVYEKVTRAVVDRAAMNENVFR